MDYFAFGGRLLVGLVFAVSALSKLRMSEWRDFVESTRRLLGALTPAGRASTRIARLVAPVVVAAEAAVVVLMIPAPVAGLLLAAGLLIVFGVAIGLALRRRVSAPCRCFGGAAELSRWNLVRNGLLLAVAGVSLTAPGAPADVGGAIVAVCAAAVLSMLVIRLDDVGELFTARLP